MKIEVYPLSDHYHGNPRTLVTMDFMPPQKIMAINSGVKRCPEKGEWYLSGAIIAAYKAPNDLSTEYYIAKLVRVETKTVTEIVEIVEG